MIFWLILVLGVAFGILVAIKGWAGAKAYVRKRAERIGARAEKQSGVLFETATSRIDDEVRAAEHWWPYLQKSGLFYVACFFTLLMIVLDIQFGFSRGGTSVLACLVLSALFIAADLALPFVAMRSDKGTANWWDFEKSDRSYQAWFLIIMFTIMSCIAVIGSTSEVANTTTARNTVSVEIRDQKMEQIRAWRTEKASIKNERSYAALASLADATEQDAEREGRRKRCGPKCEALKKEAKQYRARAKDAKRKEDLVAKIASAESELRGMGNHRTDEDPLASAVEGMSGGAISKQAASDNVLTFIGLLVVFGATLVWLILADQVKADMAREIKRRGEIADEMRQAQGLPRKYTATDEPLAQIEDKSGEPSETIVINMSQEDMRLRFKNDQDLLEVDELFGSLLEPIEGGSVSIADMYKAYKLATLRKNAHARYMTQPTMSQKVYLVATHRDDVQVTADGTINGWVLVQTTASEAAE